MKEYQKRLARLLAESGSLFFQEGLRLKDGRPTPYFVNLGVFRTGRLAAELGVCFADWMEDTGLAKEIDLLVGPSYKGSAIAQACAIALYQRHGHNLSFDYDRKEAKTYGEATGQGVLFVTGAVLEGGRALIIDDVGTSMSTKRDLIKKLGWLGPKLQKPMELKGVALALDREQTQAVYDDKGRVREGKRGPDALAAFSQETDLPVWPLLGIREAINHIHENKYKVLVDGGRRLIDERIMEQVEEYLALYGREK